MRLTDCVFIANHSYNSYLLNYYYLFTKREKQLGNERQRFLFLDEYWTDEVQID